MISLTPCPSVEDHRQSRVNRPERTSIGDYWVPRPGDPRQPLRYAGRSLRSARPCDEHAVCPDLQAVRAVLLLAVKVVEGLALEDHRCVRDRAVRACTNDAGCLISMRSTTNLLGTLDKLSDIGQCGLGSRR